MSDPFLKAKDILQKLMDHGFDAFIVGGAVRDFLLGMAIHDIDIATSATPDDVMAIFPKTFPVGIRHGTILVRHDNENYEVTTFRSETGYEDYRHPDSVIFETSIYKDLARRDFTINALAMDPSGMIIDPYDGQADLKSRRLKTVGNAEDRFTEDPLRMLRAVRFVSQLNLTPNEDCLKGMTQTATSIEHLAIERIREEFTKLLSGKWLDKAMKLLIKTGLLDVLPFLQDCKIEKIVPASFSPLKSSVERWAMFLIVIECRDPEQFIKQWRFSNKDKNRVLGLIHRFNEQKDKIWDLFAVYHSGLEDAFAVERIKLSLGLSDGQFGLIEKLFVALPIKSRSELAVNGADLCKWFKKKGGPWTGEALETIEQAVIRGEVENDLEALQRWVQCVN